MFIIHNINLITKYKLIQIISALNIVNSALKIALPLINYTHILFFWVSSFLKS
jgi:NurA-like 5'-3' nuclease